ncbi:MAG: alpha/beta fold hydrolase [Planctomycetota bacterium]
MGIEVKVNPDLYPFESHWLERGGLRYHYVDEGTGSPVVCVHGNPTWSFYYRELIKALRGSHRIIAPDHIGCGLSDKPGEDAYEYVLERRVADLEALLDTLDLRNITLVVHDWGGMIGLTAALRQRERIARVVVLNTAAFMLPLGKRLPWQLWLIRRMPLVPKLLVQGLNVFARGAAHMAACRPLAPAVRAGLLAPYDTWQNRRATLRFVQDIPLKSGDRSYELAKWTQEHLHELADIPMLICWGMRDFVFDAEFLAEWRRRFPDADAHMFADAGHYVLEDARDEVIGLVRDFLAKTSTDTRDEAHTETAV